MTNGRTGGPSRFRGWVALTAALATMGVVVCTALGAVSVGHSGWNWGSPQPQGNDLSGIDFAGGRGYASGDLGTLLRTDDAGQSWTGIATGTSIPARSKPQSRTKALSSSNQPQMPADTAARSVAAM